jgi:hypothetical protein
MYIAHIKKDFHSQFKEYKKGEVYLFNEENKNKIDFKLKVACLKNRIEWTPFFEAFKPLNINNYSPSKTIIIRSGGIGDLIALSSICEQIPGKILFLTNGYYKPVFDWYRDSKNIDVIDYSKPLFSEMTFTKLVNLYKTTRVAMFDGSIEEGNNENWFHVFYNSIGFDIKPELCRPHLKYFKQTTSNINIYKPSILIQHRASANMRSTSFQVIYEALAEIVDDVNIYVHDSNCTDNDFLFIEGLTDKRVSIIHSENIEGYLNDLFDANLTISVDSAAIHFREGIKKPAIGIYNSFTAESRCKYYKYTYSFDVKSPCPIQPCFLHQTKLNEVCSEAKEGSFVAPCVDKYYNSTLINQLQSELIKAFYKLDLKNLKRELV